MLKRIKTKLRSFIDKRKRQKEAALIINQVINTKNEDDRSDLIIKLYNLGFKTEAIELAASYDYHRIISTHYLKDQYNGEDFKKDLKNVFRAISALVIGFIVVALLTN